MSGFVFSCWVLQWAAGAFAAASRASLLPQHSAQPAEPLHLAVLLRVPPRLPHPNARRCPLRDASCKQVNVDIDTVIVDEAGCVPEMAILTLIKLSPSNSVLIGDHLQLPAFTDLHKPPPNHTRRQAGGVIGWVGLG